MSNEGILTQISLGAESSVGVAATPTVSLPVLPSDGVKTEQPLVGVEAIDTSPAKNKGFVQGVREYNGAFEMNAYPQALGYLLKSALGAVATEAVASETLVKKHTFTEAVAKPSLTVEQKIGSVTERFAGFVVGMLSVSGKVGEPIKIALEGKALSVASETAITAAYELSRVFDWTDVQSIEVGGVDIKAAIQEWSLEYTSDLNNFHGFASAGEPTMLYVKNSEVKGSLSGYQDSNLAGFLSDFRDVDEAELVITLAADEVIGNGSYNTLVITVPLMAFAKHEMPVDTEYNSVSLDFEGRKDPTNGLIKVELTNLVTSY